MVFYENFGHGGNFDLVIWMDLSGDYHGRIYWCFVILIVVLSVVMMMMMIS